MKKYIALTITALLLSVSCSESTIDLVPVGDTEGTYFQTEDQMEAGIFGVYQKISFYYIWNRGFYLQRIDQLPSDDITVNASYPYENFVGLNGNLTHMNLYYQYSYQLVARANTMLSLIEERGDIAYEDNNLKNNHIGECLFLRSYANFRLWNAYETAPNVTERILELDNAYPPNSVGSELLDQMITDLNQAITLLPETWSGSNMGRATKNSARGLLMKALVFRGQVYGQSGDFTEALNQFNAITGVTLTPNYNDNFDPSKENNEESLFEFQANKNAARVNGWVGGANDLFSVIGEINTYYGYWTGNQAGNGNAPYYATQSLIDSYEDGDPRKEMVLDPTITGGANMRKYMELDQPLVGGEGGPVGVLSINNQRILRYADLLLLAAEATVRSGGSLSTAIGYVNQVRERARNSADVPSLIPADLPTPANTDEALTLIFDERRRELAGEEAHRWYDLRRRHMGGEIDLTTWNFESADNTTNFQSFNINFPLPSNEVIQSPNLNQNTGY